jgi:peptidyl-prolyl cis-trans isomerase C
MKLAPLQLGIRSAAGGPYAAAFAVLFVLTGCSGGPTPKTDAGAPAKTTASRAGKPGVWRPAQPDTLGPTVAIVGRTRLTRHDVDSVIATAPADLQERLRTYDGYKQLVERLALEESMIQAADAAGIEKDPEYKAEMARASRGAKMRTYYNRRLAALPQSPDSALLAYYDAHVEDYRIPSRVRVRHIQLATLEEAKRVRRALVKGALWDETCQKRSTDAATKERGGLIGYISQASDLAPGIGKAPAVVAAAFELEEGAISEPLKSERGWHLIKTDNLEPPSMETFEQVKEAIRRTVDGELVDQFSTAYTESLQTAIRATIFDDSIQVAVLPVRTPQDLFKEAQAAITAQDRIELYRRVVQRFPDDSVAVQARFMIGFTYAEDMGEYEEAKKAFEEFLQRYPNTELSTSARWMLEHMDEPPPTMEEDDVPADHPITPTEGGGAGAPKEEARRSP